MFTWICPKCGGEVLPSQSECPRCAAEPKAPETLAHGDSAARPAARAVPAHEQPHPHPGMPAWLTVVLSVLALAVVGGLGYKFGAGSKKPEAPPKQEFQGMAKSTNPLAKFVEVTGLRVSEDAQKNVVVKMVVVNHSTGDIPDMEISADIKPIIAKPGDEALCSLAAKVPSLGPHEVREITATAKTKMRAYELPDWQFLKADYETGGGSSLELEFEGNLEDANKAVSASTAAVSAEMAKGPKLDAKAKATYQAGLAQLGHGLLRYIALRGPAQSFSAGVKSASPMMIPKLVTGVYIVGQLPSGVSNLATSLQNASAFAKSNDIPVPDDATKAMAAL